MNYKKHYDLLIYKAKNRNLDEYGEWHHIIPLCLNGEDDSENLVKLTPEEHYVAHQLLVKIYPNNYSLIHAAKMMTISSRCTKRSNKLYGWLRRKFHEACQQRIGEKNGSFGSFWITNGIENRKIKNEEIPDGWWKRSNTKNYCYPKKIKNQEHAKRINELFLSGMKTDDIAKLFNWNNGKSVIVFLNRMYPDRKKYAPNEKREIRAHEALR